MYRKKKKKIRYSNFAFCEITFENESILLSAGKNDSCTGRRALLLLTRSILISVVTCANDKPKSLFSTDLACITVFEKCLRAALLLRCVTYARVREIKMSAREKTRGGLFNRSIVVVA